MLGTIPIVHDTTINAIFEGLPALILPDITVTNEAFLEEMYEKMRGREYDWDRLFGFYWILKVRRATYLTRHPLAPSEIYPPTLPPPPPTPSPNRRTRERKPPREPKRKDASSKSTPPSPTPTPTPFYEDKVRSAIEKVRGRLAMMKDKGD